MKKTKYFLSGSKPRSQIQVAVGEAETKRDQFLQEYDNTIVEIVSENIQFLYSTNDIVVAIISLTYFKKDDTKTS